MNLHQVLTGAVNPGDNCFSVGSVNNVPFTVRYFKLWKYFPTSYLGALTLRGWPNRSVRTHFCSELLMNINIESKVQYENSRCFANAIVTPTKGEIKVVIMSNTWP